MSRNYGTFYPPNSVVEVPLNHFFSLETKTEIVSVGNGRQDVNHDTGRRGLRTLLDNIDSAISKGWNDLVDGAKSVWSSVTDWIDGLGVILSKVAYFILFVILGFFGIMIFSKLVFENIPKERFQEFKDEEENEKMRQTTNP